MVDDATVEAFASLFRGRTDVWGSVKGLCNKEPVTLDSYRAHLEGKVSLGIYPLLDNGTCHFAAVDIDVKNFDLALSVRQELHNLDIPAYIAESKGKGYHIYMFSDDSFKAAEIRKVLSSVLTKLNLRAEIFPKQDALDANNAFGNYINLPCFGNTRQWQTTDLKTMPLESALEKFKQVPQISIDRALAMITPPPPPIAPKAPARKKGKQKRAPPCVERIIGGVTSPGRDEAAFALARHYLDQQYLPEEVMALLKIWDRKNSPPLNDDRLLEDKVRSAQKGYKFGCKSILENPFLGEFCPGQEQCEWLKKNVEERKKRGELKELTFYENETHLYEQVFKDGASAFMCYEKATGNISRVNEIELPDVTIVPVMSDAVAASEKAVWLPEDVEEYGSTENLVEAIKSHIREYLDIPDSYCEHAAWYIIMTWIYDRVNTVSYLRFQGDTGTGKSRALDVVGCLAYKPMMAAGAVTVAPLYRMIRQFHGTLILDEADFRVSDELAEVIKVLNCGYERNRPVLRCNKENPDDVQILPCYGPKVFATRQDFADAALESRCLTHIMEATDRDDIPPLLADRFYLKAMSLRNRLLLWRFRNRGRIDSNAVEDIDLGNLEPRLKQVNLTYALAFKDMPEVLARFKVFLAKHQEEITRMRSETITGRVVDALFRAALEHGREFITTGIISKMLEESGIELDVRKIGKQLKTLHITVEQRRVLMERKRFIVWNNRLMKKLARRYFTDVEDFTNILADEDAIAAPEPETEPKPNIDTNF